MCIRVKCAFVAPAVAQQRSLRFLSRRKRRRLASPFRPSGQIDLRPRREGALAGEATLRSGQTFPRFVHPRRGDWGKQAEIDVHRLERARTGADRFDVTAGDVVQERPDGGCQRRRLKLLSEPLGGREPTGDEADRGAFDVALAAGDLTGEAQAGRSPSGADARRAGEAN